MDVGITLKKLIAIEGVTITQLGERSGIAASRVSLYARNLQIPRIKILIRKLDSLGYEILVMNDEGKLLRCSGFGSVVKYIIYHKNMPISHLASLSDTDDSQLRRYMRGEVQPTMCVANRVLDSVGYNFKVRKKEK